MAAPQVTVFDVQEMQQRGTDFFLLDVREPWEYEVSNLGGVSIPLGQVPERISEIPLGTPVVVMCRSGARSEQATLFLQSKGYQASNMTGGIRQWALALAPGMRVA